MSKSSTTLERAPVNPGDLVPGMPVGRGMEAGSRLGAAISLDYFRSLQYFLDGYSPDVAFCFDGPISEARSTTLDMSRDNAYVTQRSVREVAANLGGTVGMFESEFRKKGVVDIGCGDATIAGDLMRNARARMTLVDIDNERLSGVPRKIGRRVIADGSNLSIRSSSQDGALSIYSSILWAETPRNALESLHEIVRVLKVGGTGLIVPLLQNPIEKIGEMRHLLSSSKDQPDDLYKRQIAANAAIDIGVLHAIFNLINNGNIDVTWVGYDALSVSGKRFLNISVIVDKTTEVNDDALSENIDFVKSYTPADMWQPDNSVQS